MTMLMIVRDGYGNYTVQKALNIAEGILTCGKIFPSIPVISHRSSANVRTLSVWYGRAELQNFDGRASANENRSYVRSTSDSASQRSVVG